MVIALLAILAFIFSYQQLLHPNLSVALFAQNGVYTSFSKEVVFLEELPENGTGKIDRKVLAEM